MKAIPLSDETRIAAALDEGQGRARSRTLDRSDLLYAAECAERALAGIPKRMWTGTTVVVNPHRVPNSYKYAGQTSIARLVRRSADWALTAIQRDYATSSAYGADRPLATRITLPPEVDRAELLASLLRHAGIDLPAPSA